MAVDSGSMKERLRGLLAERQFAEIAELAAVKRRVLGVLVSLTYEPDPATAWRAVEAQGEAAASIACRDPEYVRGHLRRLHWLISEESGGICWYAPQAMAEIVSRRYSTFGNYASIVATLLETMAEEDLACFRPGILWAIARLGPQALAEIEPVLPRIVSALEDPDPQTRGMAVWCLARLGRRGLFADRADLFVDDGFVVLYHDGNLDVTSVSALAVAASPDAAPA